MLVGVDQDPSTESQGSGEGDLDLSTRPPICDEAEFSRLLDVTIADAAPRLFAVVEVEVYGEEAEGRIAAWGMAFDGHAEVVGVEGRTRASLCSPEFATFVFGGHAPDVTARVVWVNPDVAGPPDGNEDDNEGAAA